MKKILLLFVVLFSINACEVLDVEPQSSIPATEAFKDRAGIERGIFGAYSSLQSLSYYGRTYTIFADLAADNLSHPEDATATEYAEVDGNNILPENGSVGGIWSAIYDGINVANNVIVKVPEMEDMSEAEKNEALAELYFIRAINHFNLLNYFGGIPIKTTPTIGVNELDVPRNSVAEVYSQIIEDLTFAEEHLPSASNKIRASKYAAVALLARVYLYKGDYAMASAKATQVISEGGYAMPDDYSEIFAADGSPETIFEVDFTELDRNRIAEYNYPKSLNGRREVAPSEDILESYETGDERFDATFAFAAELPYVIKYDDLSTGSDNVIVLRLAEMYLIRAEAEALNSGDMEMIRNDINKIRLRANLPETTADSFSELLSIIEDERRLELAFEGHRWFDLVRTDRAVDLIPTVTNQNQTLFPIPSGEIQTNNNSGMTQNPGY